MTDPYKALNLSPPGPSITKEAIRAAYLTLVLQYFPDKDTDPADRGTNVAEFRYVQEAYELLSNERARTEYDERFLKLINPSPLPTSTPTPIPIPNAPSLTSPTTIYTWPSRDAYCFVELPPRMHEGQVRRTANTLRASLDPFRYFPMALPLGEGVIRRREEFYNMTLPTSRPKKQVATPWLVAPTPGASAQSSFQILSPLTPNGEFPHGPTRFSNRISPTPSATAPSATPRLIVPLLDVENPFFLSCPKPPVPQIGLSPTPTLDGPSTASQPAAIPSGANSPSFTEHIIQFGAMPPITIRRPAAPTSRSDGDSFPRIQGASREGGKRDP